MKAIALAAMLAVSAGSAKAATIIPAYLMQHARYDIWYVATQADVMLPGNKTATIDSCYLYGCYTETFEVTFGLMDRDIYFGLPTEPFYLAKINRNYSTAISTSVVVTTDYIPGVPLPASGFLVAGAVAAFGFFRRHKKAEAACSS